MKGLLAALLYLLSIPACAGNREADSTMYLGTWRLQNQEGRYTVMSIKNNGSIEVDIRIEGQLSKIVEKSEKAHGTWQADKTDTQLTLNLTSGAQAVGWPEGATIYHIRHLDAGLMVLASPDNREYRWEKSGHRAANPLSEETGPSISIAPLVVSLAPGETQSGRRYKWLCVALDVRLSPGCRKPEARPQWHDKTILLLSSKTYEDVNTTDKLKRVENELRDLLNPYMDGDIQKVVFTRTVVTGNQEAVETFCSKFES